MSRKPKTFKELDILYQSGIDEYEAGNDIEDMYMDINLGEVIGK